MIHLPRWDLPTKDVVSRAFPQENPNSGTRVSVGDMGQEEIHKARETDVKDGD